jgi:rhamnogalacturonyl hydrolase YesR
MMRIILLFFLLIFAVSNSTAVSWLPAKTEVVALIHKANDYWQERNPVHGNSFWNRAAYHTGNMAAFKATGEKQYYDFSYAWSEVNQWKGARSDIKANWKYSYGESNDYVLFGDYQICFQVYADLYHYDPADFKIARAREVMEYQMSTPNRDYWWWADGLYMVMPVMTRLYKLTGNEQYLHKLYEYFLYADSIMYDAEEGLYYRDAKYVYPKHTTINGLKDFWARGSGWVFAGFARVLADLPNDDSHRPFYIQRYRAMAQALKKAQHAEGYWTRSLLDPQHAPGPETSGTAFYTYGLLWGLNNGVFSWDEYGATVEKAWNYLTKVALQYDGRVGYVQPIGENANPYQTVSATSTADFGVGAFLLAMSEMLPNATGEMPAKLIRLSKVDIENPSLIHLEFSEVPTAETATLLTNYSINDKEVNGVVTFDGMYTVTLELTTPLPYGPYSVKVVNLTGSNNASLEPDARKSGYFSVPLFPADSVITVSAIGNQIGNTPLNTLDNSINTRWSQPGPGQWIRYDLGSMKQVWAVDMAFYAGDQRNSFFDIEVSVDGFSYEKVLKGGVSSAKTTGLERFSITPVNARYVQIIGNGNSTGGDNWNSLTEVRVRYDGPTGLENLKSTMALYPNPYSGGELWLNLENELPSGSSLLVFTVNGQQVYTSELLEGKREILLKELRLAPGTYFYRINTIHLFGKLIVM